MDTLTCPECGHDRLMGGTYPGVYDGVLIWFCEACGHAWPRFSEGSWPRLHAAALRVLADDTPEPYG